jgi:hypothetical protein
MLPAGDGLCWSFLSGEMIGQLSWVPTWVTALDSWQHLETFLVVTTGEVCAVGN